MVKVGEAFVWWSWKVRNPCVVKFQGLRHLRMVEGKESIEKKEKNQSKKRKSQKKKSKGKQ